MGYPWLHPLLPVPNCRCILVTMADPNEPKRPHPSTDLPCTPDEGAHADKDAPDPREYHDEDED